MTPDELRNSILQLAISGKLINRQGEDCSCFEFKKRLISEKNLLINSKKIKKEKEIDALTEQPFEIPDSWVWIRTGDCVYNKTGLSYNKENLDIKISQPVRVLRGGNISNLSYSLKDDDILIDSSFVDANLFLRKNSLITPAVTSLEHIGKMARIEKSYNDVVVGGFVLMLIPFVLDDFFSKYLLYTFSSNYYRKECRGIVKKSGQAFYNLSREKLMNIYIPLPPPKEQEEIVKKIEELMPLVDEYEELYNKLEQFNNSFPDSMEKSILKYAFEGKLVEQKNDEGTGVDLYKSIVSCREELVKKHLLKKPKNIDEIADDELPFDIPSSWHWCRISSVLDIINGFTPLRTEEKFWKNGTINWMTVEDINTQGKYLNFTSQHITEKAIKSFDRILPEDSTFICCTSATIGKVAINKVPMASNQQFNGLKIKKEAEGKILNEYVYWYCYTLKSKLIEIAGITTFPFVSVDKLGKLVFPLPPFDEQKRIVAKIEELIPLVQTLKGE